MLSKLFSIIVLSGIVTACQANQIRQIEVLSDLDLQKECSAYKNDDSKNYCWIVISSVMYSQLPLITILEDSGSKELNSAYCEPFLKWGLSPEVLAYTKKRIIDSYVEYVSEKYKKLAGKPPLHNSAASDSIIFSLYKSFPCKGQEKVGE